MLKGNIRGEGDSGLTNGLAGFLLKSGQRDQPSAEGFSKMSKQIRFECNQTSIKGEEFWLNLLNSILVKIGLCRDEQGNPRVRVQLRSELRGACLKLGQGQSLCPLG